MHKNLVGLFSIIVLGAVLVGCETTTPPTAQSTSNVRRAAATKPETKSTQWNPSGARQTGTNF
jgi:hypothetical protein